MHLSNNSRLEGVVFIENAVRLSDVLNHRDKNFIVLLDHKEGIHIVNKQHIVEVMEIGEMYS